VTPLPLERTHLARHDLDWLPPSYRAVRWGVAGAVWTGIFGAVGVLLAFSKFQVIVYGKGLAALAAGGYFAGDRAARAVLRGRLRKLAEGAVDLSRLPAEPDGELVHVEGRIRARQTLPSLIGSEPVVWRRASFGLGESRLIHEAATDFWIVAEKGEPVLVEVADARLLISDPRGEWFSDGHEVTQRIESLPLPPELARTLARRQQRRQKGQNVPRVRVGERALRDGDRVEIVGYKSRTIDPTIAARLERDTPYRATLRSGRALPLLIAPIDR
jgi:hypothetical protein